MVHDHDRLHGCDCGHHLAAPRRGLTRREVLRYGAGLATAASVASAIPFAATSAFRAGATSTVRDPSWPAPNIVSRAAWGADESRRINDQTYWGAIEKIVVHHTVTPNNPSDPAAVVNGVYQYHTSGVYSDIAYNLLIDHNGAIYQGRWAADGDLVGERNGKQVQGAHTGGMNSRTIGIALLGTFTSVSPSPAAIDSLRKVLTWKCARWGIDPNGATPYTRADNTVVTGVPNILGHRDAKATTCPGDPIMGLLPQIRQDVSARLASEVRGYWILSTDGSVKAFGDAADLGDPKRAGTVGTFAGIAAHPSGRGYWVMGALGGIFSYGVATFHGSTFNSSLNAPVVDIASTPSGNGYWVLARDGGVFSFGDAKFYGSTGGSNLNAPVNRLVPTQTGHGYWLLADDGGVFSFGDAEFHGSMGAAQLNSKVISMAATPGGAGYWLLGGDGGVFSFGDAQFWGSMGAAKLNAKVISMAATPGGAGYWLLGGDGGVFSFGDAQFWGSTGAMALSQPVIAMLPTGSGGGYLLLARDGGIFAFGDAPFYGSAAGAITRAAGFAGVI